MLGASLLPARFRSDHSHAGPSKPGYFNRQITTVLQSLASRAFTHPIHTIVFVAVLASTSYVGLLEGSLSESANVNRGSFGAASQASLMENGRNLSLSEESSWKWIVSHGGHGGASAGLPATSTPQNKEHQPNAKQMALMTLVFPNTLSKISPRRAPAAGLLTKAEGLSAELLPSTSNALTPITQDTTLAFAVPLEQVPTFLAKAKDLPGRPNEDDLEDERSVKWIMEATMGTNDASDRPFPRWLSKTWTNFVDLIKNAESLDITIMVLGYISMHLTFVSLFMSMRHMGSNFWLAFSVLLSSVFAFLFGLIVTAKLGVDISFVLLSEGLPFLVVTIGFEKPIILTKAVLSASLSSRREDGDQRSVGLNSERRPRTIKSALNVAVYEKGFEIVRDYLIEIAILSAGAASGVQGGLRQFCFLAAWILAFDCILLFTFYTAILSVKLEINRIKRHVTLRRALEEDGISTRVAENVASRNEWPRYSPADTLSGDGQGQPAVFGRKVKDSAVPKFKALMVTGFVFLNVLNLATIPFRSSSGHVPPPTVSGLSSVLNPPPLDPFKVAQEGLDHLRIHARAQGHPLHVAVLPPIKYVAEGEAFMPAMDDLGSSFFDADQLFDVMIGGRVIEGVLKSLEDPLLSKWIIVTLMLSLVLNGYLFNAARWSIKDTRGMPDTRVEGPPTGALVLSQTATGPQTLDNAPQVQPAGVQRDLAQRQISVDNKNVGARDSVTCQQLLQDGKAAHLTDQELIIMAAKGQIPGYALEKTLQDPQIMTRLGALTRAVKVRRAMVSRTSATAETSTLLEGSKLPYEGYNYELVHGACCENVIGYMPLPVGVAGPLVIDGQSYFLPMATTEGVLVASTNRGCKAINAAGGAITVLTGDGMTRGPCVGFPTLTRAGAAKIWLDSEEGQKSMKKAFNSTSRFARLQSMKTAMAGTYLYIRFKTTTGDAMGMNMISKGVECALSVMAQESGFDDMAIISVSGNFCTDKKPAAINWIDGRGKSVVAEAIIPGSVVRSVLKSDVNALVELNTSKNLIGSALAGSIGGFNAHAANIVTALFLATGQDPAQNVESSNCITVMRKYVAKPPDTLLNNDADRISSSYNGNLQISVSMPSIEVGTIGGGTVLEPQSAMLDLLGVRGAHPKNPGDNARRLARIIGAAVLAGELSLCSALAAGHLVRAHMAHNRSTVPTRTSTPVNNMAGIANNSTVG